MAVEKILEQINVGKIEPESAKFEKTSSPEAKVERILVSPDKAQEAIKVAEKAGQSVAGTVTPAQDFQKRQAAAIDSILSDGLNEIFLQMKSEDQKKFKQKGEETVAKISVLLGQTKVKVNKIISLIRDWLRLIPGVNKFFLEQEVKIKADKIIRLKDK